MTPKEKAEELYNKMCSTMPHHSATNASVYLISQQCALIAVDEILEAIDWHIYESPNREISFWQEVKQETEAL